MSKSRAQIAANKVRVGEILTTDVGSWSREYIFPNHPELDSAIDLLFQAAKLSLHGEPEQIKEAQRLIGQIPDAEMRSWFDDLAQNSGKVRLEILNRKPQMIGGKSSIKRPTKKQELEIIVDQGFHCRYCGVRIIPNDQFKKLQDIIGYEILPNRSQKLGKTSNVDIHGIWLLTRATVDHVEPVSQGGLDVNRRENLVACCWPCNYAKWKYTIEELEIDNPICRPAKHTGWQGLTDILP